MRLGMVTTWGSSCGIATYSEELIEALERQLDDLVVVLAEAGLGTSIRREAAARPVETCWTRHRPQGNAAAIEQVVRKYQLNVLHLQHEFGLWPNDVALHETLRAAHAAGARTVVTLHTVFPSGGHLRTGALRMLERAADVVTVHSRQAQAAALAVGTEVFHVPHGTKPRTRGDRAAGLALLGVPPRLIESGSTWGLVFGFQGTGKNIVGTLRSFALARATGQLRSCGLLIAGEVKDEFYSQRVNAVALETGYLAAIFKHDGFLVTKLADVFAAADFGVLNHVGSEPAALSASGQVHLAAAFGLPLAVADAPIYSDALAGGFAVPFQTRYTSAEEPTLSCANAIAALGRSATLRTELGTRADAFARATSWDVVAERLLEVYRG